MGRTRPRLFRIVAHTTQFILDHLYFIKNGLFLCYLRLSRDL